MIQGQINKSHLNINEIMSAFIFNATLDAFNEILMYSLNTLFFVIFYFYFTNLSLLLVKRDNTENTHFSLLSTGEPFNGL